MAKKEVKGIVIFDLDDLLLMNVHWYWAGWQMFKDVMVRLGFSKYEDDLVNTLNRFDEEGVKKHGFRKERFGEAMAEAYEYYCKLEGKTPDPETREGLIDIGLSVYRHKPILYPNAKGVLAYLRGRGYKLYCVTKGDEDVQYEKICTCQLDSCFNKILFVSLSKKEALSQLLKAHKDTPKENIYFIGNSMKDDMKPAIELGINAILIYEYTWDFDEEDFKGKNKVRKLNNLAELVAIL